LPECSEAFTRKRNSRPTLGQSVKVNLIAKQIPDGTTGKVRGLASGCYCKHPASEHLLLYGVICGAPLALRKYLTEDRGIPDHRGYAFLAERLRVCIARLERKHRARVKVREVPDTVQDCFGLDYLGAGFDYHPAVLAIRYGV